MRERLREVSYQASCHGVVLFGQQADVVGESGEMVEERYRLRVAPLQRIVVGQPERACEEGPFTGRKAVDRGMRGIPGDESIPDQRLLDRAHGAENPRVGRRQKTYQRQHEQARVDLLRPVELHECAQSGIEAFATDRRVDPVSHRSPAVGGAIQPELLDCFDGTIEGHPSHHL